MNTKKIFFVIVTTLFLLLTQNAEAIVYATFPDSKTLQPMPDSTIKPNISGNINSTGSSGFSYDQKLSAETSENETTENPDENTKVPDAPTAKSGASKLWMLPAFLGIAALGAIVFIKKLKNNNNA